jgi:hypothetical protein
MPGDWLCGRQYANTCTCCVAQREKIVENARCVKTRSMEGKNARILTLRSEHLGHAATMKACVHALLRGQDLQAAALKRQRFFALLRGLDGGRTVTIREKENDIPRPQYIL